MSATKPMPASEQDPAARTGTMTGAEAIIRCLEAEGVDICWGIPGGAILPLYDAFAAVDHTVRHILVRHEQGAGHMAQGYARATGRVGVCIATSGPGATNLVTPVADAFLDSTPIVAITGQVPTHLIGSDAFQEADTTGIFMPITKHTFQVQKLTDLPRMFKEAFHIARSGRPGPVLIDIPKDLQQASFEFSYPATVDIPGYKPSTTGHPLQVQTAADAIARARRPVLYVGGGVINAGAETELAELAEALQIPVVTTLMAKGAFPDSHPLCVGLPGMHGSKFANWTMNRADLLITVGARFDDRVTGKLDAFAPGARVVHIDIDPAEISKNRHADVPIVGELRRVLPVLRDAYLGLRTADRIASKREWRDQVEEWRFKHPFRYRRDGQLKAQFVMERFRDLLADRDPIWVTGVGQHQMWAAQWLKIEKTRHWLTSGGLGTMGFGVPAAIGAQMGCPENIVINIDGDGCFQMTMQELATAVAFEVPAIHAVINNGWLGMVRQWQTLFHDKRYSETLLRNDLPDYVKLAEAFGALGLRAETEEEVDIAIMTAVESRRPCVIDFRVDPDEKVYPMVPAGSSSSEMIDDEVWENDWVEDGV